MELHINNLTKDFHQKQALRIENLHISKGTFLGIIGPNGAGKSTLAKILANIEEASSGEILYNHSPFTPSLLRQMTLVFQKPYLLRTTVYHNIAYPLKIRGMDKTEIDQRVISILKEMEILDLKDQKAWTLSGGEAQKVALARGLIFKPSLLILDEFTANIDPASMSLLEKSVKNYHAKYSPTILMVTHNLLQAKRLCSHVAFMHRGEVAELGPMEEVIYKSKNPLTRGFVAGEIVL